MKIRILCMLLCFMGMTFTMVSCGNDDDLQNVPMEKPSKVTVDFGGDNIEEIKKVKLDFKEVNTGVVISKEFTEKPYLLELNKGSYIATANGVVALSSGEEVEVAGTSNFDLNQEEQKMVINLSIKAFSKDFVIEEIFFTGVKTNEGKNYNSGRYFKLTNNTDKALNTGGLLITKSEFNPVINNHVEPDIRDQAFAVSGVLMIPNELGKTVQPGDFIVVADMAANHNTANIPAYDLSNADYEYPNLENPALGQVDNPAVPDAKVIYSTLNFNMFFLHNRGYESYAIARFPEGENQDTWLANYTYEYEYINAIGNVTHKSTYKIPNEWIIDGVNCAIPSKWEHNPLAPSIDNGYTYAGEFDKDPSRFGKTVRRKIIGSMKNGKPIYKDTNNSDVDFVKSSDSSLQGGIIH